MYVYISGGPAAFPRGFDVRAPDPQITAIPLFRSSMTSNDNDYYYYYYYNIDDDNNDNNNDNNNNDNNNMN